MTQEQRDAKTRCNLEVEGLIEQIAENFDIEKRVLMEEVVAFLNRKIAHMLKKECAEEEEDSFIFPAEWTLGEIKTD